MPSMLAVNNTNGKIKKYIGTSLWWDQLTMLRKTKCIRGTSLKGTGWVVIKLMFKWID